jgi:choline/glycine/proline betaine transport protein
VVPSSLWLDMRENSTWQQDWTLFYWGWWISWSPFVGVFIARISKGRTIRQFVFYVFLVPTIVTFCWFAIFGGAALNFDIHQGSEIYQVVDTNLSMSLNALLDYLPIPYITKWVGLLLVVIFFITSSDSGSLVDDMVTSGGHPNPPVAQRAFWGVAEGAAAATLLYAGGLRALQTAAISSGLPQSLLVLGATFGLVKALRVDKKQQGVPQKEDFYPTDKKRSTDH